MLKYSEIYKEVLILDLACIKLNQSHASNDFRVSHSHNLSVCGRTLKGQV